MQSVALIVRPDFQLMSLAALSAFEFANLAAGEKLYDISVLSEHGGLVASSLFTSVDTQQFNKTDFDTVLISGAMDRSSASDGIHSFLVEANADSRRVGALCVGAFALAESGLLDGRRATVHWARAKEMRDRFPAIKVEEDRIFIIDGKIWTSAGMTAALDLTIGMVEKDYGAALARTVSQRLVLYHRRAGGQSQHSAMLELSPSSDRIQQSLDFARKNLRRDLSVEDLADAACLSPRQFSRSFREQTGSSPAKAIENLRLEAARLMIEQGRLTLEAVASETGFGDRERMRRAFLRVYGQSPQSLRRTFGSNADV
ncbi:Transcriptional regulator GlxA family, contains an amidase domain and an AraC-type DNA-binding HTH domain [Pseudomonas arsenicoxydans]|uniref:Transcriptional regulator GlxA family, contains an amidase domain and an AraC-type DNA-binding HTH domain n=1 Tax=Pseudomonas arsenicoxydans TaxID=702115 RepID=A0A1H0QSR2_9PSED|nr:GlxA family transcriptional regulator [Pseudomonas arsenicoxydans]SDP20145.1 Transcriptional regulator GlxA family, contains an amidase domain and an AraC-type DNA-binding HTH domain [Pseudomonas arsenicoxydans]